MSKATMVMVYSAITETEVSRQYAVSAAKAERSGYVPTSEVWDRNTLTVTYQYSGEVGLAGQVIRAETPPGDGGFRSRLGRRLGLR